MWTGEVRFYNLLVWTNYHMIMNRTRKSELSLTKMPTWTNLWSQLIKNSIFIMIIKIIQLFSKIAWKKNIKLHFRELATLIKLTIQSKITIMNLWKSKTSQLSITTIPFQTTNRVSNHRSINRLCLKTTKIKRLTTK